MSRTSVSALAQINTAAQRPEREREGEHGGGSGTEEEEGAVRAHLLSPLPTQLAQTTSILHTRTHTHTLNVWLQWGLTPPGGTFLAHREHGEMQIKQQGLGPGVSASSDFTL